MSTITEFCRRGTSALLALALALPLLAVTGPATADQDNGPSDHPTRRNADNGHDQGLPGRRFAVDRRDTGRDDSRGRDNGYGRVADDRREPERRRDDRQPERRSQRGTVVRHARVLHEMPRGYRVIHLHDRDYYVHQGHYYVHEPRGYVMVDLPIGTFVMSLPDGFLRVHIGGIAYFVAGGIYYRAYNGGYTVVETPAPVPTAIGNASGSLMVNVPLLNVRNGPSYDFSVIGVVNQGMRLPIHGEAPGWHYIRMPSGRYGWVKDDYIVVAPEEPQG